MYVFLLSSFHEKPAMANHPLTCSSCYDGDLWLNGRKSDIPPGRDSRTIPTGSNYYDLPGASRPGSDCIARADILPREPQYTEKIWLRSAESTLKETSHSMRRCTVAWTSKVLTGRLLNRTTIARSDFRLAYCTSTPYLPR